MTEQTKVSPKAKVAKIEDKIRSNKLKSIAKAHKLAANVTLDEALTQLASNSASGESRARVSAAKMREEFGPGWYRLVKGEARGDNAKAMQKAILEKRDLMREIMIKRGCSGVNKPWSDLIRAAKELDNPHGETREQKPWIVSVRERGEKLYLACSNVKEEDVTEEDYTDALAAAAYFALGCERLGSKMEKVNEKLRR